MKKMQKAHRKMKWGVAKHRLGGWCVTRDGKRLDYICRTKKAAIIHMKNLKTVADAVCKKFENT